MLHFPHLSQISLSKRFSHMYIHSARFKTKKNKKKKRCYIQSNVISVKSMTPAISVFHRSVEMNRIPTVGVGMQNVGLVVVPESPIRPLDGDDDNSPSSYHAAFYQALSGIVT